MVVLQEPEEQERRDAFVAVAERVVLDRQVEQAVSYTHLREKCLAPTLLHQKPDSSMGF